MADADGPGLTPVPELPEVEVVRRGLAEAVPGSTITAVEVTDSRALTRHPSPPDTFAPALLGAQVTAVVRRGKFLWFTLDPGRPDCLLAHLGMSGRLLLREPDRAPERHERIRLRLRDPLGRQRGLVFADQRTFGSLAVDALVPTADGAPGGAGSDLAATASQVTGIARDPLDPWFEPRRVRERMGRTASAVKRVLLDQRVVSGIGNIYADEALWSARIHPDTPAHRLSDARVRRLFAAVRAVFVQALAEGGTSFDAAYVNVNGESGRYVTALNVYGRGGRACPRCGATVERAPFANRSSHFCPRCQRAG